MMVHISIRVASASWRPLLVASRRREALNALKAAVVHLEGCEVGRSTVGLNARIPVTSRQPGMGSSAGVATAAGSGG